jgi:hypothetical protein
MNDVKVTPDLQKLLYARNVKAKDCPNHIAGRVKSTDDVFNSNREWQRISITRHFIPTSSILLFEGYLSVALSIKHVLIFSLGKNMNDYQK